MSLLDWSTNPANNTTKPGGIDWSEGMLPSAVNNSARVMMADVANWLVAPVLNGSTAVNGTISAYPTVNPTSVATAKQIIVGEATKNAAYSFALGYYLNSGTWTGIANVIANGVAGPLQIQPSGGLTTVGGDFTVIGSASFSGTPTAPTASTATNSTQIATTAYVKANLTDYAPLAGATFTGLVSANASIRLPGAGPFSPTSPGIQLFGADPNYKIGFDNTGGGYIRLNVDSANSAVHGFVFSGGPAGSQTDAATLYTTGLFQTSGPIKRDTQFYLDIVSSKPRINFDSGDYLEYDRGANKLTLFIGGTARASVDSAGNLKVSGSLTASTTP